MLLHRVNRNSNLELLRIIAMLMILYTHLGISPEDGIGKFTFGLLEYLGGVGDDLFFAITAWFMCMEQSDFRKACRRVWNLEKQLLFWSLSLFVVCSVVWWFTDYPMLRSVFDWAHLAVVSVAPLTTQLWWYPSAYAIFALLCPFINKGLRAIGREGHAVMATLGLAAFGVVPFFYKGMGLSVFLFLYQYVMLSYFRWYLSDWEQSRRLALTCATFGIVLVALCGELRFLTGWDYGNAPWTLPAMMAAFGLILMAIQAKPYSNWLINLIAGSTLSVYLVHGYWPVTIWLQDVVCAGVADMMANHSMTLRYSAHYLVLLAVYLVIILIDIMRRFLFSITADRTNRNGLWFDYCWSKCAKFLSTKGFDVESVVH